jgi:TPR repeat protein
MSKTAIAVDRCNRGDFGGCVEAGDRYAETLDPDDGKRAFGYYEKACEATRAVGCFEAAKLLEGGWFGVDADAKRALGLYSSLCAEHAHGDACARLGNMQSRGVETPVDPVAAAASWARACELDSASGCTMVGLAYAAGSGMVKDDGRAYASEKKACDLSDADGCAHLADLVSDGRGVSADAAQAASLRAHACDLGSAYGCSFVADELVAVGGASYQRGVTMLARGCNSQFDGRSCWRYGQLFARGKLAETQYDSAEKYLSLGCNLGMVEACVEVARGTTETAKRERFERRACELGDAASCAKLGTPLVH